MRIISGNSKPDELWLQKNYLYVLQQIWQKKRCLIFLTNSYHFHDISVLDLFAGTGNISYEFASRGNGIYSGCRSKFSLYKIYLVKTSEEFDMPIQVIKADVFKFLEKTNNPQTIIFADPPYELNC